MKASEEGWLPALLFVFIAQSHVQRLELSLVAKWTEYIRWLYNAIKKSKINTVGTVSARKGQASGICGRLALYVYPEDVYTCKGGKNYGVKVDIKGSTDI